jgi:hypothetical protein
VHSSVMLRRDRVLALGGYSTDPARQPPEDYELWGRIARVERVANLPERLLVYREVPRSLSRLGENPFQAKLVLLSAENLALAAGLPAGDRHCADLAAIVHRAPRAHSSRPDLAAMQAVLRRCGDRIAAGLEPGAERGEFDARRRYWARRVRNEFLHQVVQPRWVRPVAAAGYRGARSMLRTIRSLARRVVG